MTKTKEEILDKWYKTLTLREGALNAMEEYASQPRGKKLISIQNLRMKLWMDIYINNCADKSSLSAADQADWAIQRFDERFLK